MVVGRLVVVNHLKESRRPVHRLSFPSGRKEIAPPRPGRSNIVGRYFNTQHPPYPELPVTPGFTTEKRIDRRREWAALTNAKASPILRMSSEVL